MKARVLLAMMFVFLVVAASGCVQTDVQQDSSSDQSDQISGNEIMDSLQGDIIDDSETIDIGELI
jgi:hypothetical protein